ncbi:MAG TPA: hypothetical protein VJ867_16870 [Gemmatimonadaceae bacterium]|nr:hypothetical protein [Gemmatimonadaceae bacterium]
MRTDSRSLGRKAALVLALMGAGLLTACIHVPPRVWYNGQAMQQSNQYNAFMYGLDRSPVTLRGLYYSSAASNLAFPGPQDY